MSPADGSDGADPQNGDGADLGGQIDHLLLESLMHHLVEKGVLTKNDALSVVQTVAQVKRGRLHDGEAPNAQTDAELMMLQRMYASFEALADRPGAAQVDGKNVHRLRPPLHGDQPEFPRDD